MKLSKMGIIGTPLEWFKSYLSDRTQLVDINGKFSRLKKSKSPFYRGVSLGPYCSYVSLMTFIE